MALLGHRPIRGDVRNWQKRTSHSISPLVTPRPRGLWAACANTNEWNGQSISDQNRAHILTIRFQRSAAPSIITSRSLLCTARTSTSDKFKIQIAAVNKLTKSSRSAGAELPFRFALSTLSFGGVKANESDVGPPVMNANRVAVDYMNVSGANRLRHCWR
jgi:hypothetical protein